MVATRMPALYLLAIAIVSLAPRMGQFVNPFNGISILDCPEQNQTSPMSIFVNSITSPSDSLMVCGVKLALGVGIEMSHLPSVSTLAIYVSELQDVFTLRVAWALAF